MTRTTELEVEEREARLNRLALLAVNGGLDSALGRENVTLLGFSYRHGEIECLMTIRGLLAGRKQVAFVGGESLGACLRKAMYEASRGELRWREDRWAEK